MESQTRLQPTTDILKEHLKLFVTNGEPLNDKFPKLLGHTQAVELCVSSGLWRKIA